MGCIYIPVHKCIYCIVIYFMAFKTKLLKYFEFKQYSYTTNPELYVKASHKYILTSGPVYYGA